MRRAGERQGYGVDIAIDDQVCRISVIDDGGGFDPVATPAAQERSRLDPGRGLLVMRALIDRLDFVQDDDGRHRVTLEKRLDVSPKLRLLPT